MKTVHIVYGPPLAGKSTFVRENMGPDDLVFDMDAVQNALCYGADHAGNDDFIVRVGVSGVFKIIEIATEARVEGRVYEFLAGPFEMPPADVQNMPLPDFVENVTRLTKENDLSSFFTSVRKLAQNM